MLKQTGQEGNKQLPSLGAPEAAGRGIWHPKEPCVARAASGKERQQEEPRVGGRRKGPVAQRRASEATRTPPPPSLRKRTAKDQKRRREAPLGEPRCRIPSNRALRPHPPPPTAPFPRESSGISKESSFYQSRLTCRGCFLPNTPKSVRGRLRPALQGSPALPITAAGGSRQAGGGAPLLAFCAISPCFPPRRHPNRRSRGQPGEGETRTLGAGRPELGRWRVGAAGPLDQGRAPLLLARQEPCRSQGLRWSQGRGAPGPVPLPSREPSQRAPRSLEGQSRPAD